MQNIGNIQIFCRYFEQIELKLILFRLFDEINVVFWHFPAPVMYIT